MQHNPIKEVDMTHAVPKFTLRESFDRYIDGVPLDQVALLTVRSYITVQTRECIFSGEITSQDASNILHFRTYEKVIVDALMESLRNRISEGLYISQGDREYYKKISKDEFGKIFGDIIST